MKILAIDTTTKFISVALGEGGNVILETISHEPFMHAERINLMTEGLLKTVGWHLNELNLLLLSEGPGLFTSLRVSFSFAKALKIVNEKLTVRVISPFRVIWKRYEGYNVAVCLDAKKNELFATAYDEEGRQVMDVGIYKPEYLNDKLKGFLFVGEGAEMYKHILKNVPPNNLIFPHSGDMIRTMEYSKEVDIRTYEPFYLRLPDAVVNLIRKKQKRS